VPCHFLFLIEEITVTGTLFILFATFFWALDTLIRYPLLNAGLSPIQIVFTEHLLLVLCMFAWLKWRRLSLWQFTRRDWPALLIIGGLGSAIGTLAFTEAFSYLNPTLVILLQKLQPLVAISLAAWVLKERVNMGFALCVILAFAGSLMLMFEDLSSLFAGQGWHYSEVIAHRLVGYGLTLIAVISWGASTVFGKKLALSGHGSAHIMAGRFTVGLIVLLPFLMIQAPFEQEMTSSLLSKIAVMVLISGALGMLLYYQGLQRVPSKFSALAEMGFPVMAGFINWWVLGLALTPLQMLGGALLISASFAVHIEGRLKKVSPEMAANVI